MISLIQPIDSNPPAPLHLAEGTSPLESPSLTPAAAAAYELKFLLTEAQAREVEARVQGLLLPDAHGDPVLAGAYQTTSLYCDTAEFDVFHRVGSFRRRKHRLRRYGQAPLIFLERKSKRDDRVKKRRTGIPMEELASLANPMSATTWPGHWFHRHLLRRLLLPVCRIAYERTALVGLSAEGPLRLTFDRNIRGTAESVWSVAEVADGLPVLTGQVICEMKYRAALPSLFKGIVQALQLTPTPVSKYRAFLREAGRVQDRRPRDA